MSGQIPAESFHTLEPKEDLDYGTLCHNSDHGMEDVVQISTDPVQIQEKAESGWRVYPGKSKYILRAPETTLVDLADPLSNPSRNPAEIIEFFDFLEERGVNQILDEVTEDIQVRELEGETIETEKRIVGASDEIEDVPQRAFEYYLEETGERPGTRFPELENHGVEIGSIKTAETYREIKDFYDTVAGREIDPVMANGVWENAPEAEADIFIAKAAIPYFLGFMEDTGERPFLWEYHKGSRDTKEIKMFEQPLQNRDVNIYDKSYSGETLNELAERVEEQGGNPEIIALFPKSERAVSESDYVLFGDEFYKSEEVPEGQDWHRELYSETFGMVKEV